VKEAQKVIQGCERTLWSRERRMFHHGTFALNVLGRSAATRLVLRRTSATHNARRIRSHTDFTRCFWEVGAGNDI
jgi:hypothetical protein